MTRGAARAAKEARRRRTREEDDGAPEWRVASRPHLELTCRSLDQLVGIRNLVLRDLDEHLTDEHRALLGWPLSSLNPEVAARVRADLGPY